MTHVIIDPDALDVENTVESHVMTPDVGCHGYVSSLWRRSNEITRWKNGEGKGRTGKGRASARPLPHPPPHPHCHSVQASIRQMKSLSPPAPVFQRSVFADTHTHRDTDRNRQTQTYRRTDIRRQTQSDTGRDTTRHTKTTSTRCSGDDFSPEVERGGGKEGMGEG